MTTLPYPCGSAPLTAADFNATLQNLNADAAAVWSILQVESGKAGYLPDRRPQILFERAQFHTRTQGAYDTTHPGISASTWGGYTGGMGEYTRLGEAYDLDSTAALQSASWGIGQVMGFNHQVAGYASVTDFVGDMCASEALQLKAFENFLKNSGIAPHLASHDWNTVALKYNGPGQVAVYAARLSANFAQLQDSSKLPDLAVRAAQLYLSFLSHAEQNPAVNPGGIDGVLGNPATSHTVRALNAFQSAHNLPTTDAIDDQVLASLAAALAEEQSLLLA